MNKRWMFSGIFWGLLLIVGGVLFLLENLGVFEGSGTFWSVALALGGLFFITVFVRDRHHWWSLIPGIILLALGAMIALETFAPQVGETWTAFVILGGIALAFTLVYIVEHSNWWAIIPAGVLWTIATVAVLGDTLSGSITGGIMFAGIGLTFALVALLPNPVARMKWAWIPAIILLVFGLLVMAAQEKLINYVWAGAFLIGGAYLIWRALSKKSV